MPKGPVARSTSRVRRVVRRLFLILRSLARPAIRLLEEAQGARAARRSIVEGGSACSRGQERLPEESAAEGPVRSGFVPVCC